LEQQPNAFDDDGLNAPTAQKSATAQNLKQKLSRRPQKPPDKPATQSRRKPSNGAAHKPKPETVPLPKSELTKRLTLISGDSIAPELWRVSPQLRAITHLRSPAGVDDDGRAWGFHGQYPGDKSGIALVATLPWAPGQNKAPIGGGAHPPLPAVNLKPRRRHYPGSFITTSR
jgi:hypothetical protein